MIAWRYSMLAMEGKTTTSHISRHLRADFIAHIRANLEREMRFLFGSRLRAEGGDGTLSLPV
jgi:hypothetical protein